MIKNNEQMKGYDNPYEKVELYWPLEICKNGIEIIDSPGLNEDMGRQTITLDYLSTVDAVIFVVSCDSPVSLSERNTIDTIIQAGHSHIFFICNRFDIIDEEEQSRIKNYCRSVLNPLTEYGNRFIFFISACNALKGRQNNIIEMVRESGLIEVENSLQTFLATERGRVKILLPAFELYEAINDVWQDIPNREKLLHFDLSTMLNRQVQSERDLQFIEAERNRIVEYFRKFPP